MYGEDMQKEGVPYENDVQARHRMLSEFVANNSNLSPGDRKFNETYGTNEHIFEPTRVEIAGGIVEARDMIMGEDGLLVYLSGEPPVGMAYEVVNNNGLYMLVAASDGMPYAITKHEAFLHKFLNNQAA